MIYTAYLQRARGAPKTCARRSRRSHSDATSSPRRAVHTPSRGVVFEHVQNIRRRMAFCAMAQRAYSVYTALLATVQRAPRRSRTFSDAVGTL